MYSSLVFGLFLKMLTFGGAITCYSQILKLGTRALTLIWSWVTLSSKVFRLLTLHINVKIITLGCSTSENIHRHKIGPSL